MIFRDNRFIIELNEDFKITNRIFVSNMEELCTHVHNPQHLLQVYRDNKIEWHTGEEAGFGGMNIAEIYYPDDIIATRVGDCFENSLLFRDFLNRNQYSESSIGFLLSANLATSNSCIGHSFPMYKGPGNKYYTWSYCGLGHGVICGPYSSFKTASEGFGRKYIKIAVHKWKEIEYTGPDYFFAHLELNDLKIIDKIIAEQNRTLKQGDITVKLYAIREMFKEIQKAYKFYHLNESFDINKTNIEWQGINSMSQFKKLVQEFQKEGKLVYKI